MFSLPIVIIAFVGAVAAFFGIIIGIIGAAGIWAINLLGAGIEYSILNIVVSWMGYLVLTNLVRRWLN